MIFPICIYIHSRYTRNKMPLPPSASSDYNSVSSMIDTACRSPTLPHSLRLPIHFTPAPVRLISYLLTCRTKRRTTARAIRVTQMACPNVLKVPSQLRRIYSGFPALFKTSDPMKNSACGPPFL